MKSVVYTNDTNKFTYKQLRHSSQDLVHATIYRKKITSQQICE